MQYFCLLTVVSILDAAISSRSVSKNSPKTIQSPKKLLLNLNQRDLYGNLMGSVWEKTKDLRYCSQNCSHFFAAHDYFLVSISSFWRSFERFSPLPELANGLLVFSVFMSVYQSDLVVVSSTLSNGRRDLSCTQSMTYRSVTLQNPHRKRSQYITKSRSPHL